MSSSDKPALPRRQRGMFTIATVLLIGLSVMISVLSVMYAVRALGQRQVAVHASTHAQAGAWAALDVVKQYLEQQVLAGQRVDQLSPATFDLGTNTISIAWGSAQVISPTVSRITSTITSTNAPAKAASVVEAVFDVQQGASETQAPTIDLPGVVTIHNDLDMRGGLNFKGGENARLIVEGHANLTSASITGLYSLRATDDITIGSGISVQEVFSNGKLVLMGSGAVTTGAALGDISVQSAASQGVLRTNGNLTIANGAVAKGDALGWIKTSSGGSQGVLTSGGDTTVSNGSVSRVDAAGNLMITSWPTVKVANSRGVITCPSQWWSNYETLAAQSAVNCPQRNILVPGNVSIKLPSPLTAFKIDREKVDAYLLKDSANYVFEREGNLTRVTVQNVHGITDGSYYLGSYPYQNGRGWQDFLCASVNANGVCTLPESPSYALKTVCQGFSTSNSCISYSRGVWTISGRSLAPGVMFFKGDLNASTGTYYNTFIATGNIATSGAHKTYAMNFSGYSAICRSLYPSGSSADFKDLYPTNYCDQTSETLKPNAVGNAAFVAGGFEQEIFSGGNISLGASTEVFGSVIAGDVLETSGSTIIHGFILAAGQGKTSPNTWNGSTTIDLRNLPKGYTPGAIPDVGSKGNTAGGSTGKPDVSVKWLRYR